MIADEVRSQIELENADAQLSAKNQDLDPASSSIARTLSDPHPHVFVVGGALDVVDDSGAECALSDGDALQLSSPPPPDATAVSLSCSPARVVANAEVCHGYCGSCRSSGNAEPHARNH